MHQLSVRNRLLLSLPADVRSRIVSEARPCGFDPNSGAPCPRFVHFIETGSVSLLALDGSMELAAISNDGMLGYEPAFKVDEAIYRVLSHAGWNSIAIPTTVFHSLVGQNPALQVLSCRYFYAIAAQVGENAKASSTSTIFTRLARRLLIAADHLGNEFRYTHAELGQMLCVRRPGITLAIHQLEGKHAIKSSRGRIQIRDRQGLELLADGTYGGAKRVFKALFPIDVEAVDGPAERVA